MDSHPCIQSSMSVPTKGLRGLVESSVQSKCGNETRKNTRKKKKASAEKTTRKGSSPATQRHLSSGKCLPEIHHATLRLDWSQVRHSRTFFTLLRCCRNESSRRQSRLTKDCTEGWPTTGDLVVLNGLAMQQGLNSARHTFPPR